MKALINYFFLLDEDEQLDQSDLYWITLIFGTAFISVIITLVGGMGL